jgi:endonuclease YncB( thermonuclease family)|tara:strand:+ start:921 stop:1232 length:312 start_codon:yes stop_codon:yes gene_type:complete
MYTPDNWVIFRVNDDDPYYKILAGWSGGYLDGDSWRVNSGIARVTEDDDYCYFHGYSGSTYKCHKNSEQLRINTLGIWGQMKEMHGDKVELIDYEDLSIKTRA